MTFEFLEYTIKKAEKEGASQAEAFLDHIVDFRVLIKRGEVKIGERKDDAGIGIRVALKHNGGSSIGFTYITELTREAVDQAIKQAVKIASAKKPDPYFISFQDSKPLNPIERIYDRTLAEVEPDKLVKLAICQIETASKDKRIDVVDGYILPRIEEIAIMNSLGVEGSYRITNFYSAVESVAKENTSVGSGFDEYSNCFYNEDEAIKIAENASSLAIDQLHAKPIKKGKFDLIVSPHGLAQLFAYTLAREVGADLIFTKRSPLVGKIGQQIASEVLTLHDDGRVPNACGSKIFDDEGCPTQRTAIVEKGILKHYLYSTYWAKREGIESTGNSSRTALLRVMPKYLLEPSIRPTNLIVEPGTTSLDSLISDVKNGIITKDFLGSHTASVESGDFSITLHCAFRIENGEITYPIKEAMIGSNILDFLRKIAVIANDVKQIQFHLNVAFIRDATLISPSVLIKDVTVAG